MILMRIGDYVKTENGYGTVVRFGNDRFGSVYVQLENGLSFWFLMKEVEVQS